MILADVTIEVDAGALLILPLVMLIGWFASRVLGVRQTWFRTFVTGFFGWLLGVLVAGISAEPHATTAELLLRIIPYSILATMAFAIAFDFMARPGSKDPYERLGRLPQVPHPVRRVQHTMAPPLRFRQVLGIARREGLLHRRFASAAGIADPEFGPRLRSTLEQCGGMFIKLGQVASTRSDLLPPPVITELTQLQASVPPAEPGAIRAVVEEELGRPVEEVFATFDWTPLAAASIGQVHRATLVSGEGVVVKVQRPMVADVVSRDTQAMLSLASFVQRRTSIGLRTDVVTLVGEFTDAVNAELDFTSEGQAGERVRADRGGDEGIHIPAVHLDLCTRRLLVLEEVSGVPVSNQAALDASPVSREVLADRLLQCFLAQILEDGVFHADPHPGNILLAEDGTLNLLDFGSTGILDPATLEALGGLLLASSLNDPELLQRSVLEISPPPPGTDLAALEADLGRFMVVHMNAGTGFDVEMLKAMIEVLQRNHLAVPVSLTLLSRALITLDGTLRTMAPGFAFAEQAQSLAGPMVMPAGTGDVQNQMQKELLRAMPSLRTLPGHAEAIGAQLRSGQLTVRTARYADANEAMFVRDLANRAILAASGLVGILTAAVLLLAAASTGDSNEAATLEGIGYVGLFLGTIITMRVVALVVRDRSA
ncbi:MAG TPA: AarF/UbiB family protein [Acidimicrobiia bacterium]|jgi:ubiquinone biosynthesis protein